MIRKNSNTIKCLTYFRWTHWAQAFLW